MKRFLVLTIINLITVSTVLAQQHKTDRENDGLKGAVKAVVTENAELTNKAGKLDESNRKPEGNVTYDVNGNRTKERVYDGNGNLASSTMYSYINGERVSIDEPVENKDVLIARVDTPSNRVKRRSDDRYTHKYKYKFDSKGNVREEVLYQNDGSFDMRYVYNIQNNQKETLVYAEDKSLNQKYLSVLDDKGNEVETRYYNTQNNSIESKEFYTYAEFDSNGNWTKRLTSEMVKKNGKSSLKQTKVTYRIITYY